jgi:hypothetical protein
MPDLLLLRSRRGRAADALRALRGLLGEAERVEMTGADLRRDPVRLADEARSVSLFGDRRQIPSAPRATRRSTRSKPCCPARSKAGRC